MQNSPLGGPVQRLHGGGDLGDRLRLATLDEAADAGDMSLHRRAHDAVAVVLLGGDQHPLLGGLDVGHETSGEWTGDYTVGSIWRPYHGLPWIKPGLTSAVCSRPQARFCWLLLRYPKPPS